MSATVEAEGATLEGITHHPQPNGTECWYKDATHNYFESFAGGKLKGKMDSPSFVAKFIDPNPGGLLPWYAKKAIAGAGALRDLLSADEWRALWDDGDDAVWTALRDHELTPDKLRDSAGERGTTIHDYLEQTLRGEPVEVSEALEPYRQGVDQFLADHAPEPLNIEEVYFDATNKVAGRADLRARLTKGAHKGRVAMIDLKTSKTLPLSAHVQVKGYALMAETAGWGSSDMTLLVHCPGDGNYFPVQGQAADDDWAACLDAAKRKRDLSKRIRGAK